jgi:hypothetical protein
VANPFESEDQHAGALDPAANPFRPGMGLVPPDFGGRDEPLRRAKTVVDRLARGTPAPFVLYRGVRGVGKTALLAYVRQQAARRGILTAHLEADRDDTDLIGVRRGLLHEAAPLLEGVDRDLARRLAAISVSPTADPASPAGAATLKPAPNAAAGVEALVSDVALLAGATGRSVLLTVDEVHEAEDRLLRPLLRAAHRAAQDALPLGMLLSGLPSAAEHVFREGQTYTERLERVDLGLLDRVGTHVAIRGPFTRDAGAEVDELVVDAVHDGSGGYPWFVQLWGAALWDAARSPDRIELPDARQAGVEVHDRVTAFFADRWSRVPSGRATRLVVALAEAGGDVEVGTLLETLDLTHQAISPARRDLLDLGLCWAPGRGRLAFTVPGFASWIARTRPQDA